MIGKVVSDLRLFHNTSVDSENTDATDLQFPDLGFVFFGPSRASSLRPKRNAPIAFAIGAFAGCGERGIRTLGTVTRTHAFQACSFSHSDTSPVSVQASIAT